MIRSKLTGVVVSAALLASSLMILYAAEPPNTSQEFRNKFITQFSRNGLSTTPGDAMMLRILIESRGAKRGVEVGAAYAFGAINMGVAFERTGGHLYSLELDPERVKQFRKNVKTVGLEKTVTCIEGDALETLSKLEGEFDFVFIDAVKSDYFKYLKLIEPKLKKGAVVVADNVIKSGRAMPDYLEYVQTSPDYDTVLIRSSMEKSDGMTISYKIR